MKSRLILSLFPATLLAQIAPATRPAPPGATVELSAFEVTTARDIGYQSTHAAEVTRMNTAIGDIPMNVTVLNQEFLEDTLARSTEDVLEYVPGFVSTSNNDSWTVRGFSNANTKFLNGFLQQESIGKVSLANVERVEVLKGPAAVLYGQGGYAATVNRVTKRPLPRDETTMRFNVGPVESWRGELDTSGAVGSAASPVRYRVTAVYDDGNYYRRITHGEKAVSAIVSWQVARSTRVSLEHLFVREEDGGAVWRQPMMRGEPRGFAMPDGSFLAYGDNRQGYATAGDIRRWDRGFTMLDLQHSFSPAIQLRLQAAHDTKDQLYDEHQPEQGSLTFLKDAVLMPRRWRVRTQDVENWRSRNEVVAQFSTGPVRHRALAGFSWDVSDGEVWNRDGIYNRGGLAATAATLNQRWPTASVGSRFNVFPNLTLAEVLADVRRAGYNPNMIPPLNAVDPDRSPPVQARADRPPLPAGNRNLDRTENTEWYAADVASFLEERVFLTAGVRHTSTDDRRRNGFTGLTTFDNHADSTTWSAGAVWHLNAMRSVTLYANANSSFVPVFTRQPDGTPLDPERGNQKEIGLRFSLARDRVQGLVSVYEIRQQNIAVDDPNRDGDWFTQIDGIRSRGAELSLNARFTDEWSLMGGYAYNDSRDTRTRARSMYAPLHMATAFNKYAFREGRLRGLDLALGSIFLGDRPIDPVVLTTLGGIANTPQWMMPGKWRFDAVVRYAVPRSGRVRYVWGAKIQNVFDNQEIYKLADSNSVQRQPGRTFQASLTAKF